MESNNKLDFEARTQRIGAIKMNIQLFAEPGKPDGADEEITYTLDGVQTWIDTNEDAKKHFQSQRDAYFQKGLETWKGNNLPKLKNDWMKEANPEETADQKKFRELQDRFDSSEKARKKTDMKNITLGELQQNKMPSGFADFLASDTEENTKANIQKFKTIWDSAILGSVEETFKANGRTPEKSPKEADKLTREMLKAMTPEQINKKFEENQEFFEKL